MPPPSTDWSNTPPSLSGRGMVITKKRLGDIFLWAVIIFLLGIIACLTYKHIELLNMFHTLHPNNNTENITIINTNMFPFSPTTKAQTVQVPTSPPVQVVEVEGGMFHTYYVEYALFTLGVAAIALAVCRDVCRRK